MEVYGVIKGTLSSGTLRGTLSSPYIMSGTLTVPSNVGVVAYDGDYEFTPAEAAQTIEIAEKKAIQNITIDPIPSNYGLITYNGSTITVS